MEIIEVYINKVEYMIETNLKTLFVSFRFRYYIENGETKPSSMLRHNDIL